MFDKVRIVTILVVIVCHSNSHAGPAIVEVSLPTNDIVYDPISDLIYASVPSSAGALRGNTITPIDPHSGALGTSVFVSSEPTLLALADDGSRVYVASDSTNTVTPFSLLTMSPGAPFFIGGVDRRVDDMAVAPGHPNTLAVSKRVLGQSPRGSGLAVYVDGVQLPQATTDVAINNDIEFGSTANVLYGHANEISDRDFNAFEIDVTHSGGVLNSSFHVKHLLTDGGLRMEFDNERMYFTNGQVVDVSAPAPVGSFTASGPLEPDSATGRTFFVVGNKLKAFSQTTFVQTGEMMIPGVSGSAKNLISLGEAGLALATSTGKVLIIHGVPGDYDGNGTVEADDYEIWKTNFGSAFAAADGNGDGVVDGADFTIWRDNLGVTLGGRFGGSALPQITGVPEPSTITLLMIGLWMTKRRRGTRP